MNIVTHCDTVERGGTELAVVFFIIIIVTVA